MIETVENIFYDACITKTNRVDITLEENKGIIGQIADIWIKTKMLSDKRWRGEEVTNWHRTVLGNRRVHCI